jgi:hypothetical protein
VDQNTFHLVVAVAAIIVSLSFIIQAVMFGLIYRALKKVGQTAMAIQAKAEPVLEKAGPVIDQVQGTLVTVRTTVTQISEQAKETFEKVAVETRAVAAAVSVSSQEISSIAHQQAVQLSQALELASSTLERQVTELDHLMLRTQRRIEDTTVEVQSTVVEPVRELAALLTGLRRMIESMFRGDRKPINQAYQDEEMFI